MVAEFQNKDFSIAGLGPGQAEDWILEAYLQLPGWAKFRTYQDFVLSERFNWFDSFAKIWSGIDPYDLDQALGLSIVAVGTSPSNYFEVAGDVLRLLPPSASVLVEGTVLGQTNLDGYWTVESIEFTGANTRIYVTEDVLASVPANLIIPPILYLNIDNYGWGAEIASQATYPIAPLGAGTTLFISINREAQVTATFAGGETTAQQVVDRLNSEFSTLSVDDLIVAVVEGSVPVIKTLAQATENYIDIEGGTANTTLLFGTREQYGFGQFAQLFDIYFEDPQNATAEELETILKQYVQHGYFMAREAQAGGSLKVQSEKAGDLATCQVWGYWGDVLSKAVWPIPARTPTNNELEISLDGEPAFTAVLTVGATTAEEIVQDLQNAFLSNAVTGKAEVAGNGQIVVGGLLSVKIIGGSANTDLNFPNHTVWGNNYFHGLLGFQDTTDTGAYDVGFFETFDEAPSVAALFAGGTSIESQFETFEWTAIYEDLDEVTISQAPIKSWAEWLGGGEVTFVNQGAKTFITPGDKRKYFYPGVKAIVQDSTGNDNLYTVVSNVQAILGTMVEVAEAIPDPTADGYIYPLFFPNGSEDFEQGWRGTFLTNPDDPPCRFWDGVLVGNERTFPINVPSNRNEMWIYVASEENLVHITIDPDTYDTAADLVANMNAKFAAASGADLEFSVHEESTDQTSAKIGFGWDGSGSTTEEFYFANQHGTYEELDIREVVGLIDLVQGVTSRVKVPSRYFKNLEGAVHGTVPDAWADDPKMFDVDPDSRFSYTIQTTPAAETVVVPEGQDFALFNQLKPFVDNSANESFIPEGWGGAILDEPAFEATLQVAWFDQPPLAPQQFENFEEGW